MEQATQKLTQVQQMIVAECDGIKEMLLQKNAAYGNSALDPVRIFSRASSVEQINVRLDDKLSRLSRGNNAGEDVELDIMGYLVLRRIARKLVDSNKSVEMKITVVDDATVRRHLESMSDDERKRLFDSIPIAHRR